MSCISRRFWVSFSDNDYLRCSIYHLTEMISSGFHTTTLSNNKPQKKRTPPYSRLFAIVNPGLPSSRSSFEDTARSSFAFFCRTVPVVRLFASMALLAASTSSLLRSGGLHIHSPPSATNVCPVIFLPAVLHRNKTPIAMSHVCPGRPNGIRSLHIPDIAFWSPGASFARPAVPVL